MLLLSWLCFFSYPLVHENCPCLRRFNTKQKLQWNHETTAWCWGGGGYCELCINIYWHLSHRSGKCSEAGKPVMSHCTQNGLRSSLEIHIVYAKYLVVCIKNVTISKRVQSDEFSSKLSTQSGRLYQNAFISLFNSYDLIQFTRCQKAMRILQAEFLNELRTPISLPTALEVGFYCFLHLTMNLMLYRFYPSSDALKDGLRMNWLWFFFQGLFSLWKLKNTNKSFGVLATLSFYLFSVVMCGYHSASPTLPLMTATPIFWN